MYSVDELDTLTELTNFPVPLRGIPCPLVLADDDTAVVSYSISSHSTDTPTTAPLSVVSFHRPRFHLFIASDDEAIRGHPLSDRGLRPYSAYRVDRSSLVRYLERTSSVRSYHDPKTFDLLTHYIFTFGDSIFECVAESVDATVEQVGLHEEYDRTLQILKG